MNHLKTKIIFALCLLPLTAPAEQVIKSYIPNEWPDERYTVHGDGTVTDTQTGLIWKQCSEGQAYARTVDGDTCTGNTEPYTWKAALEHAATHTFAGRADWRVPNIEELRSLAALDRYEPAINLTAFPNTISNGFLSASPHSIVENRKRYINFDDGDESYVYRGFSHEYLRLVASGQ